MQQERYGEIMTAVYSNGYATEDVDKGRYYTVLIVIVFVQGFIG